MRADWKAETGLTLRLMLKTYNIGWGKGASGAGRERKLFTLRVG